MALERFCEKHEGLLLSGSFPAAEPALEYLKSNETDLIFLDVMLPGINGFEFLDQLPFFPKVILTSSDTGFAFTAFQYRVTDYLKKPFSYPRFEEAVNRASRKAGANNPVPEGELFIRAEGHYIRLHLTDILYVESMGDYVKYVTTSGEHVTHSTLKNAGVKLPEQQFMKVHRCYIVNLKQVAGVKDNVLLMTHHEVPVSKPLKAELLQRLNILP
jgi:DNA-binding LytR/AlgR family response regulator